MAVQERLMATGSWGIDLRPDTPRSIRDAITPFSMVAVFSSVPPITQTDANVLAAARWIGIVHKPGPQLSIGGPGLAGWLGQDGISYDVDGTAVLPETLAESTAGSTLNAWLDDIIIPGTPFSRGTTGPAGTMKGSYRWITPRELLDTVAAHFGAEWRIRPTLTLDVASYTTLYGATPTVVITRNTSGRDIDFTSIEAALSSAVDVTDYASRVVVLGSSDRAASGGSSSWTGPEGVAVKATRVIDSPDVPTGSESSAAASYVAMLNSERREVRLSTAHFDVAGEIAVGSLVYLYDPETGITGTTPVQFRGETIRPVTVRCMGLQWPIRRGMGVALRTGSGTWTDLTPYVVPEGGDAEIEIGAAQQFVQGDQLALRADMRPRLQWGPWMPYAATWDQTVSSPTLGNGTIDCRFRRLGTSLEVSGTIRIGSTTTLGAGHFAVTMPAGCVARAVTQGRQTGTWSAEQAGVDFYSGICWVDSSVSSGATIYFGTAGTPVAPVRYTAAGSDWSPFEWGNGDAFTFSLRCEIQA